MNQPSPYERLLAVNGIPLLGLGLKDVALRRSYALRAVELLEEASTPVLGGDVYFERGGTIEIAYANWHVDRELGEGRHDYATRSCRQTKKYILEFPHRAEEVPLFVLVVTEDER